MENLGSYVAEFRLIVSITAFAHGSSTMLESLVPHLFRLIIIFYSFTWFYLLVRQGTNPSFKFLYWKYFLITILMLEQDNGADEGEESNAIIYVFVLVILIIIILLYGILIVLHGWNLEQRDGMMQPVCVAWDVMILFFNNGIGIMGMAYFSRWKMLVFLLLMICVLTGLFFLVFLEFIMLMCFFSLISYVALLCFRVEIGIEQRDGDLDFPITIPIPFDILSVIFCHYIADFTRLDSDVGGNVLEVFPWGSSMLFLSTVFFMFYYYYHKN